MKTICVCVLSLCCLFLHIAVLVQYINMNLSPGGSVDSNIQAPPGSRTQQWSLRSAHTEPRQQHVCICTLIHLYTHTYTHKCKYVYMYLDMSNIKKWEFDTFSFWSTVLSPPYRIIVFTCFMLLSQAAGLSPSAGGGSVWTFPAPGFSPVLLRQPARWGKTFTWHLHDQITISSYSQINSMVTHTRVKLKSKMCQPVQNPIMFQTHKKIL